LQQSTLLGISSVPDDEVNYAGLSHSIVGAPDIFLDFTVSFTKAEPGFTLEQFDLESKSTFLSAGVRYQLLRQRKENMSINMMFDSRDSSSDLLNTPFIRDNIRALRLGINYDIEDAWGGHSFASLKVSQGLNFLGSSEEGDQNLSRASSGPNFTKAELSVAHLHTIINKWSLFVAGATQLASQPLFSAEEFGYGGRVFGRAYDNSEITGDYGANGSVELRYDGWETGKHLNISQYGFYDIGKVWNRDVSQVKSASGTSAGVGVRASTSFGMNGNIGLAWPLTREAATPIYGQKGDQPRLLFEISQEF
jgi:hemolysin activation/secretion protein